jgi:hypothetical protein
MPPGRRRASAPARRSGCCAVAHLKIIALVISFCLGGRGHHRAAAQHGRRGLRAASRTTPSRRSSRSSGCGCRPRLRRPDLAHEPIHSYLGIGFALMILPVSLGASALVMLFNAALWAPALARVLDQSLRYTVDKTTREILFLPLPDDIKLKAKSFVDVTVDRAARGRRADAHRPRPAVGAEPRLAADQLRQPDDGGAVDCHVAARAARVPEGLPAEHRAPRPRPRGGPAELAPTSRRSKRSSRSSPTPIPPACCTRSTCSSRSTSAIS